MTTRLPTAVEEIGRIHFEGNIIPHSWYQRITLESGKPDMPAIVILAEIIYWYRPYQTLTKDGKPLQRKHFDGDMFQCSAAYFEAKFGFTKTQARRAITRLEEGGLIRREFRDVVIQGILRNNITFIEPVPLAIMAITHPPTAVAEMVSAVSETPPLVSQTPSPTGETPSPTGETPSPTGETPSPTGERLSLKSHLSETTTETTTEITTTTPNPSSTNRRAAEPESARGGGGVQDRNPKDRDGDHGIAALETSGENPASGEEVQAVATTDERGDTLTEAPAKLVYPAKLTEREREDIAQQVCLLPLVIAQQMLDVIASKMQSAQIKTNPAAVLRGIVRKYRADPAAFDPSPGFGNAEARRRRAETEARARAEVDRREREREAMRVIPASREVAYKSIANLKRLLRGHA
ncbi:MAG: hypothetical protein V9H25_08360 [Candidatus Competibacter sp.]